ncbi:hypothetical protein ACPPVQ_00310 [Diaminobutyricibacter sp. McL0618]|uniref:hypothetical protein n=1 Tax=Leifsonia sp. McL0618 TaxID=3415677 RepID=UPI003CF8D5F8
MTFDVFSALTDSRTGGSQFFSGLVAARGWDVTPIELFDQWDRLNKELHRTERAWSSFTELSRRALGSVYSEAGLPARDAGRDSDALLESMADWPLWPDVSVSTLSAVGVNRLGLLSNIDDALLKQTAAQRLGVFDQHLIVTSERMRAYKPNRSLYERAGELLGDYTHIASSARDVRGALSAGIPCIRLARAGHHIDPEGPTPPLTAESIPDLRALLRDVPGRHRP